MESKEAIQQKEEHIRQLVRALPDHKRLRFFKETEKKLKDADTYATLNFIFIAGLHHFYLGKWERGLTNIVIFFAGVVMLFTGLIVIGIFMLIAITIIELYALFRAQLIVQDYNNNIMEVIYHDIKK